MKVKKMMVPVILISGFLFVFLYFWYTSRLTPLAGDDWGYAINGMAGNPFSTLMDFYMSWSGRLVSEFWGLTVACRKELWNVLNAALFSSIFLFCSFLGGKTKKASSVALLLFLMFSVSEYLRMETYSWIMGTTYVIPLCLSLLYFVLIENDVFQAKSMHPTKIAVTSFICVVIGVTMENIAAVMLVAIVLAMMYCWFNDRMFRKDLLCNLFFSATGLAVMRLSPGSTFRTMRDHAAWIEMSLFEKIGNQLTNFFRYTFIENKYLIFVLGLVCLAALFAKGLNWWKKHRLSSMMIFVSQSTAVFFACANVLSSREALSFLKVLVNPDSLIVRGWWILYILFTMMALWNLIESNQQRCKALFFLMIAGACNMVMLYSPIFGSRSSLYFVYFMFVTVLILYNQIDFRFDVLDYAVLVCFAFLVFSRSKNWIYKYQQVAQVQMIREEEIKYYRTHPQEDAWLVRMPPYSVHGGDIEEDDTYHQEVFREYYGLDPEQKLIFYWADSYE